jgi:ribosomal subunit interface protein
MQISVHNKEADLDEALRSYVERRLRFSLARFGNRVGLVTARTGANSPNQTRCRISAEILPFGRVTAEEHGPDLFAAIDRATGAIGRRVARELGRLRDSRLSRESVRLAA